MSSGHLILVGLPGAGKTTVGPLIGAELGVEFVDVDALIEERIGTPVATIFTIMEFSCSSALQLSVKY